MLILCTPAPTPPPHFTTMVKLSQKKKKKISTHNGATSIPDQFLLLSSMVYLFLLVCFSLNPSITLQCKMAKLLAHATSIMYLSSLITLAENAWTAFASAVGWDGVNKYYLVVFFFPEKHCFSWLFLQLDWEYWLIHHCYNNCIQGTKKMQR